MKLKNTLHLAYASAADDNVGIPSDRSQCTRVGGGPEVPNGKCDIDSVRCPEQVAVANVSRNVLCTSGPRHEGQESEWRWLLRESALGHADFLAGLAKSKRARR